MELLPEVLAKLQKLVFPLTQLQINLQLQGLFNPPQQWKTTDEANPNQFSYTARFGPFQILSGKILARQPTEKELKELQQANNKKKAPKKETKKQQISKEEQQRLKKQKEEQQKQQQKRLAQWNQLTEQERNYRTAEDKHKNNSLRFQNHSSVTFENDSLIAFEERVMVQGGQWLYIYKFHTASQEQLAKIRKAKPKTLNLNDLNPVVMRCWIDLSPLQTAQKKQLLVRQKISQFIQDDKQTDIPRPNLQKSYIKLKLALSQSLRKKQQDSELVTDQIIRDYPPPAPLSPQILCVNELKDDIALALQSIAMQYSNAFGKQLNAAEQSRLGNSVYQNRKNDVQRRKQQFLYDFNISGKYKILKQKMKKSIVNVCKNKFAAKMGNVQSFTGITTEARDQFYSELHLFLVNTTRQTLNSLIYKFTEQLMENIVVDKQTQQRCQQAFLKQQLGITQYQSILLINQDYQIMGKQPIVKNNFLQLLSKDPRNSQIVLAYANFCFRNSGTESVLRLISIVESALRSNRQNRQLLQLMVFLLLISRQQINGSILYIILNKLARQEPKNIIWCLLLSLTFEICLSNQSLSKRYLLQAVRLRRRRGKGEKNHKASPVQVPTLKASFSYSHELKQQEIDDAWLQLIDYLQKKQVVPLSTLVVQRISNQTSLTSKILMAKANFIANQHQSAIKVLNQVNATSLNYHALILTGRYLHSKRQYQEAIDCLMNGLKTPQGKNSYELLLRLGYCLLQQKKYGNAKAVFAKVLAIRPLSASAILGLGNFQDCFQAIKQANMLDIHNSQPWGYTALYGIKVGKFELVNQALREMIFLEKKVKAQEDEDQYQHLINNPIMVQIKKQLELALEDDRWAKNKHLIDQIYLEIKSTVETS